MPPPQNMPFSGDLKQLPLFALLRRIQHARRSGSLRVCRGTEQRYLAFDDGELRAARSTKPEHCIGSSLIQWGYLSAEDLDRALEVQRRDGGRLGAVLVELGLVPRSVVDAEARRLMEQIVSSALSWSEGRFEFELRTAEAKGEDIAIDLSVTAMIVEGIRRVPESERFLKLLGDPSRVPHRVPVDGGRFDPAHLPEVASAILSLVDGQRDVRTLLDLAPGSSLAAAKILFTTVYCGFVELREPAPPKQTVPSVPKSQPRRSREVRDHRSLVMTTWRRIDWLSDYDFLGVSADAAFPEIEDAYRRLTVLFDPALRDRPDLAECGRHLTVLSQRTREAYETLTDPVRRAAYDSRIREAEAQLTSPIDSPAKTSELSVEARREMASCNHNRAVELIANNDVFPAIEMLEEAVRLAPNVAKYRFLLGRSKMSNRWWREEALEQLVEAARLEPRSPEIQAALAEAYLEQGDPASALPHGRMALNVAPVEQKEPYRDLEKRVDEALSASRRSGVSKLRHSA